MLNVYEEISSQWHPTRNGVLTPDKVKYNANYKVWFLCPNTCNYGCLHEWQATPYTRTRLNSGCPFCVKCSTAICIHQSLSYKHPDLMEEWHLTKNENLDPTKLREGSDKKAWWICKVCADEWEATIKNRCKGSGCSGCNGKVGVKKVTKANSLEGKFPDIAKEWHPTKNGDKLPSQFKYGSMELVWWLCPNSCGYDGCIKHEYQATITARTKKDGTKCYYCSNFTKNVTKICYHQSLQFKHPEIAKLWHPTKNGDLKPSDIPAYNKKIWLLCDKKCKYGCLHEYEQNILSKINQDSGCPYCNVIGNKKICMHDSFVFNYPELAKELHPTKNSGIDLYTISKHSNIKLWWLCKKTCKFGCEHVYEQAVNAKSIGQGCPFCIAYGNAKQFCYHESVEYEYPQLVKEFHPSKNVIKLSEVTRGSGIRSWWKCEKNHEWETRIMDRTINGHDCRICNFGNNYSKISMQWIRFLEVTYKIQHAENEGEYCIPSTKYKADGYCKETNTVCEFLGNFYHCNPKMFKMEDMNPITKTTYGELYDKTIKRRDKIKELGYNYIEIWEKDWKDGIKALKKIQRKMEKI
jgi:hypothetical protein